MLSCSCDTMVVMGDRTIDGSIIFGKNSDRQMNEPLQIRYIPSSISNENVKVQTTYIEIVNVKETLSCILLSPGNVFGAEMGFNSAGLVVGNEALFTRVESYEKGLTGMDLVRLVLQRCSTSLEGKNRIIDLLNKYGQGGNCGFNKEFYYQNSFLLVDSNEGWIIETVGKDYAAKRIRNGYYSLSNQISFGKLNTFDEYSTNLISRAIENGWCRSIEDFHFRKCYSGLTLNPKECYQGFIKTYFSSSNIREHRSRDFILNKSTQCDVDHMFQILRDHQSSNKNPIDGLTNIDICMHSSLGPIKYNQTTGSLVSILSKKGTNLIPRHFVTCSSMNCLSIYKPIWLDQTILPPQFILNDQENYSSIYSSKNLWWKSEIINRNLIKYYQQLINQIQFERNNLEKDFLCKSKELSLRNISQEERNHFTSFAFHQVDQLITQWYLRSFSEMSTELSFLQELSWEQWRKSAQIPEELLRYSKVQLLKNRIVPMCFILIIFFFYITFYFEYSNEFIFIWIFVTVVFIYSIQWTFFKDKLLEKK